MNKTKKLILILISTIIAIFAVTTISNAYNVGQVISLTYNDYISNSNIYCMEHHQQLVSGPMYYTVKSKVKIEGRKSTDHTGKTIDNWNNAKFAYILSQDNGSSKESGPVSNAIWNFGYTWMKEVGQNHAGLYLGFSSPRSRTKR